MGHDPHVPCMALAKDDGEANRYDEGQDDVVLIHDCIVARRLAGSPMGFHCSGGASAVHRGAACGASARPLSGTRIAHNGPYVSFRKD